MRIATLSLQSFIPKTRSILNYAAQDIQAPAVPYQYQLAVYIMHLMGYDDVPSDKGAVGYVTGNLITGDAGYLKFEGSSEPEFIKP